MTNKKARKELINLYGTECFIKRLGIEYPLEMEHRKSVHHNGKTNAKTLRRRKVKARLHKKELRVKNQLVYHHICPVCDGGLTTIENGVVLSASAHKWLHMQPKEVQLNINEQFIKLKMELDKS